jgi:fatty-acyl-CoA synthase
MPAPGDDSSNSPLKAWVRALEMTASIVRNPTVTLPTCIEALADKFGTATALLSDAESLTYRALAERCNRYARWALEQRIAPGDVVGLMMANGPDYLAVWVGITRTGGIVALINTQLIGDSLAHAINVVAPKQVIIGFGFAAAFTAVRHRIDPGIRCWAHGAGPHGLPRIDEDIASVSGAPLAETQCPLPSITDRALYIYTSGTTGLPKAANVSHYRVMQWSHWFAGLLDTRVTDRMYNCLPMYHSVGGVVAVGATLVNGGSVFLRQGFSVRRFWEDIVTKECTLFQYIGELCRFLIHAAPQSRPVEHRIRLCCGNGLRGDIWEPFKERFRIPQILEFYAATEANFSLYNCEGKPGAIGRIPSFLAHRFPIALVKFDVEAGKPVRNAAGLCERCATDEVGEAISKISSSGAGAAGSFEGYTDESASELKILRNVFVAGDAWFRSGDLMRKDGAGFFYFVDRIGDTFRWKGENVSTSEVAEIISAFAGVVDAIVYGVAVPASEGRAGMAAIVCSTAFDVDAFEVHLAERLPDYARPVFLRVLSEIEVTSTFKPKKQDLVRDGYDPATVSDLLYFNDRSRPGFVHLDGALFERIQGGQVRL